MLGSKAVMAQWQDLLAGEILLLVMGRKAG